MLKNKITTFTGRIGLVSILFILYAIYVQFAQMYLLPCFAEGQIVQDVAPMTVAQHLIRLCVIAPIWEELAFRVAPMQLAKGFGEDKFAIPMIIISSIFFGEIHGGPANIFIQGVMGACLAYAYVKTDYKFWVPLLLHATWNFYCFIHYHA